MTAAQVQAEVLSNEPAGAYRHLVLRAPEVARDARPGHFVACAVGGTESALLLRRAFSLHRADAGAGTVEVVVAAHGPGTRVIAALRAGDHLDVVGPLGQPFALPDTPAATVLVGGGYGSAPLTWLAEALRENGSRVDVVIGAADAGRLFGEQGARQVADSVTVTTVDGSAGTAGLVTDVMPALMAEHGTAVAYACGPMGMLRAVHEVAAAAGREQPARGRGVDGLRHRGVHDLRAAGALGRRQHPDDPVVRRGTRVRRRPAALGRDLRRRLGRPGRRAGRPGRGRGRCAVTATSTSPTTPAGTAPDLTTSVGALRPVATR